MTLDEIIQMRYPHYNPDVQQDDIELSGNEVKDLMVDVISVVMSMYAPDGNPHVWLNKMIQLKDS